MEWIQALEEAVAGARPERSLPEARNSFRLPAHLPATVQLPTGHLVVGTVVNFSTRGLKLLVPASVARKSTLMVTVKGRLRPGRHANASPIMRIECRAVWARRQRTGDLYEVGVEALQLHDTHYTDLVDFFREELHLPPINMVQRRKSRRVERSFPIWFLDEQRQPVAGSCLDLTPWCVRFETSRPQTARQLKLSLELPDGEAPLHVNGQVRTWKQTSQSFEVVATLTSLTKAHKERLLACMERSTDELSKPAP